MTSAFVVFRGARGLTDAALLLSCGTLIRPPVLGCTTPRMVREPSVRAFASSRRGIAGIGGDGTAFLRAVPRAAKGASKPRSGDFVRVVSDASLTGWIDTEGRLELHALGKLVMQDGPTPDERVADVAMAGTSVVVLLGDGRVIAPRVASEISRISAISMCAGFVTAFPRARAIAGNEYALALIDESGFPRFHGCGVQQLQQVPARLPPLRAIAVAHDSRAVALDEAGRIHDWGPHAVGRTALPSDMRADGFVEIRAGWDWLSALHADGTAYGFGVGMRAWDRIDPLLLLRMRAAPSAAVTTRCQ